MPPTPEATLGPSCPAHTVDKRARQRGLDEAFTAHNLGVHLGAPPRWFTTSVVNQCTRHSFTGIHCSPCRVATPGHGDTICRRMFVPTEADAAWSTADGGEEGYVRFRLEQLEAE